MAGGTVDTEASMSRKAWRWGRRVGRGLAGAALLGLLVPSATLAEPKGEIRVKVVGLRSDQGELRFGLYDKKDTFATKDGPIVKGARPIKNGRCEFAIPNLPFGAYAVIVGHDVNRDGKIDENPFSSERKGISNYSGRILWFPDFDKAKFQLEAAHVIVEIRVH
jgi:uncharacterized protein (DUF2141 family)